MHAWRRSLDTLTPVTVTNPIRGSFNLWITSARISRNSSPTRSVRPPCGTSSLRVVKRERGVDDLDSTPRVHERLDPVHHAPDVMSFGPHDGHADRRALPQIQVVHLCDTDLEPRTECAGERLDHVTFLLQRAASRDPEVEPLQGDEHGSERARDLADLVGLDHVSLLDVLIPLYPDAALVARGHLPHVVLEATQRPDPTLVDDDAVSNQAGPRVARDGAARDVAPADHTQLRNTEDLTDLRLPELVLQ